MTPFFRTVRRALCLVACLACFAPALHARQTAHLVRKGTVDIPGGTLYYEASGGGPSLVLIGGGTAMDLREWDDTFVEVSYFYEVARLDPRGMGQSSSPTAPFFPHEDLRELLDHVKFTRAHIVGGGAAAAVAIDFAIAYPDRVRSLVLVAPDVGGFDFPKAYRDRQTALLNMLEKQGAESYVDAVLHDDFLIPSSGSFTVRYRARLLLRESAGRLLQNRKWSRGLEPPAMTRLEEIKVPTLVVVGEDDHPEVLKLADVVTSRIHGGEKLIVPKAGHTVYMERYKAFNRALLSFLAGVPAR